MTAIESPYRLDNAMTRKFGKFWYLQESFKRTYGEKQLIEKIIIPKILSDFKKIISEPHYNTVSCESTKNARLGLLGELVVKHCVGGTLSDDKYDQEKDLTLLNGESAEVKVASYFHRGDELYIKDNYTRTTINKLNSVDKVYYIERKKNSIVLYVNLDKKFNSRYLCGARQIFAPISDFSNVSILINEELQSLFLDLSHTNFNKQYMRN